ncbi:MAG: SDR family NAD(P)-dependent oxidoreductase [Comamonadaceae bacterium]|nr:MAG: SDR family NAD(P)-dependent oxidoreductase [Comamonadaceae bacterium]
MSFDLRLNGLRAVVTGGTLGLGAAVVRALVDAGALVATSARKAPEAPVEVVSYVVADLTTADGVKTLSDAVLKEWGGVDLLINVLGGSHAPTGGFAALTDDHWFSELSLNLLPAVRLDRGLVPSMLSQGSGVVIHGSSIQRVLRLPDATTAYAASKGALMNRPELRGGYLV